MRDVGQHTPLLVGDLILLEILRGARDDGHAARLEREMRRMKVVALFGREMPAKAAQNYRGLRALGISVRELVDLVIGTFCIEHGLALLHADREFEPMQRHLGLQVPV